MSANMYDATYELERTIRQSDEFLKLKAAMQKVQEDEGSRTMFENFRNLQLQLQQKQMMGEEISEEEMEQAQKTVALVQQHNHINELMEAEQKMSNVINELSQIMMKPLEELYGGK